MVDENGNAREVGGLDREAYFRDSSRAIGDLQDDSDPLAGLVERGKKGGSYDLRDYGDAV